MASSSDDTPLHRSEKRSKKNNDTAATSRSTGRTKASLSHDATGGRGAHARAVRAQAQAPPVGVAAREFVPSLGDVLAVNPADEALDQEGRTIADDVRTMTPSAPSYFVISRLIRFDGPTPTIREPQRTPNLAGGHAPHL